MSLKDEVESDFLVPFERGSLRGDFRTYFCAERETFHTRIRTLLSAGSVSVLTYSAKAYEVEVEKTTY